MTSAGLLSASGAWAHPGGSGALRVGLIGCGGRGTGAALNAMNAGSDVRVVALADLFAPRLDACRAQLRGSRPEQVDVPDARCFVGFEGYRELLASGVDVVLIAATSHFTPAILEAAVAANVHVFCEKPHGIDVPAVRRVMAACAEASRRGLSVMSGLCWRYDPGVRATMEQVRAGAIGDIVSIQETYVAPPYVVRPREPGQDELTYQLWNWYHFHWLSGDLGPQLLIHSLDKAQWALGDVPPLSVWGMGGRQTCLDPQYGDQFDHLAAVIEYEGGVRVHAYARDQPDCHNETTDVIFGTKGRCDVLANRITGETTWQHEGPKENMYDVAHRELFEAIRAGRRIDDSQRMCLSTLVAISAQMAAMTGARLTWDDVLASRRSSVLGRYGWDVTPPVTPGSDGRYETARQGPEEQKRWQG